MLSYIIVDDERPNRILLKALLEDYATHFTLLAEADGGQKAIELIDTLQPNIVFLDIQMPDKNGFEVLQQLQHQPFVVFVTAYDEYAVKAFEQNAIDYLLKPVEEKRLAKTVEKIKSLATTKSNFQVEQLQQLLQQIQPQPTNNILQQIAVKQGAKILLLPIDTVVRFEGKEKYVAIYTKEGKEFLTNHTLTGLEPNLPNNFLRIQKGTIINTACIAEIYKHANNRLLIQLTDKLQTQVLSGTSYIDTIRNKLGL
jgi:two-component system, LytTR family, response regulator